MKVAGFLVAALGIIVLGCIVAALGGLFWGTLLYFTASAVGHPISFLASFFIGVLLMAVLGALRK